MQGLPPKSGGLKITPDVFQWVPVEYDIWREEKNNAPQEGHLGESVQTPASTSAPDGGDPNRTANIPGVEPPLPSSLKAFSKLPTNERIARALQIVQPFADDGKIRAFYH